MGKFAWVVGKFTWVVGPFWSNLVWVKFLVWVIDFAWVDFLVRESHILRGLPFCVSLITA